MKVTQHTAVIWSHLDGDWTTIRELHGLIVWRTEGSNSYEMSLNTVKGCIKRLVAVGAVEVAAELTPTRYRRADLDDANEAIAALESASITYREMGVL